MYICAYITRFPTGTLGCVSGGCLCTPGCWGSSDGGRSGLQLCGDGAGTLPAVAAAAGRAGGLPLSAGCDGGHVQPQSPPGCPLPKHPTQLSRHGLCGLASPRCFPCASDGSRSFNFFDATPPPAPAAEMRSCDSPAFVFAPASRTNTAAFANGSNPSAGSSCSRRAPHLAALPQPRRALPTGGGQDRTALQIEGAGCSSVTGADQGTDPLPWPQPASFFGSLPPAQAGPGQRAKPAPELGCLS